MKQNVLFWLRVNHGPEHKRVIEYLYINLFHNHFFIFTVASSCLEENLHLQVPTTPLFNR